MSKRKATKASTMDPDDVKKRCTAQASLDMFFGPSSSSHSKTPDSSSDSKTPDKIKTVNTPEYFDVHIYSPSQIDEAKGLQKDFRKYWNETAREICAEKGIRSELHNKAAIEGAIYTSWTLHKTHLLKLKAEELEQEAKVVYEDESRRDCEMARTRNNLDKMLQAYILQLTKERKLRRQKVLLLDSIWKKT